MSNQTNQKPTRLVTGEVRFSFVNLTKPKESSFGGTPKYSATLLLPKTDVDTKARIDFAIEEAKKLGAKEKWNGVIPPYVATPVHDGDGVKPSDGMPFGLECKGHWVFSASTSVDYPPVIIDAVGNPIINPTEIYSGMYGRIAINFAPYFSNGKKGIGCYISTNIQKTRDGDPLNGGAPSAADDFGIGGGQQAVPQYQQPMQQQATPQYQVMPEHLQVQQQVDPITGAPLNNFGNNNGGYFGQ